MLSQYPDDYSSLINGLKLYKTRSELHKSRFYEENRDLLSSIINRIWRSDSSNAQPRVSGFYRTVQWNIERGKHLEAIADLFTYHPILCKADIIALNEVDVGMNRTGNRNIAFELGRILEMHVVFVPEYLELTKGIRGELKLQGENREALHGNAMLSRYPIVSAKALRLPSCFDSFEFAEKRYGERVALIVELDCGSRRLIVAGTHLEVRNTPECRARQFRSLLDEIDSNSRNGSSSIPTLIAGDLNSGTFKRGGVFRAISAFARLALADPEAMKYALRHPETVEPLFREAMSRGFKLEGFNDDHSTCGAPLNGFDEAGYLPKPLSRLVYNQLAKYDHHLDFRLDFFLAKGLYSLSNEEITDSFSNTQSLSAQTLQGFRINGEQISDHDPIVCDFVLS